MCRRCGFCGRGAVGSGPSQAVRSRPSPSVSHSQGEARIAASPYAGCRVVVPAGGARRAATHASECVTRPAQGPRRHPLHTSTNHAPTQQTPGRGACLHDPVWGHQPHRLRKEHGASGMQGGRGSHGRTAGPRRTNRLGMVGALALLSVGMPMAHLTIPSECPCRACGHSPREPGVDATTPSPLPCGGVATGPTPWPGTPPGRGHPHRYPCMHDVAVCDAAHVRPGLGRC